MGAIEQVNCILFFSYSPLNDNAIEGLLRYSELGERSIRVYDGALLEYIICTYYEIESRDTCTEFCVLLPIFPHWNDTHEKPEISAPPKSLFQEGALDKEKFNSVILCLQAQALEKYQGPFFLKANKLQVPELLSIQRDDNANEEQRNGFELKEKIINDMWSELNSYLERHNALLLLDLMSIKDVVKCADRN